MQLIHPGKVQQTIDRLKGRELFIHLELTTGAYAAHWDSSKHPSGLFIKNAVIRYSHGSISGKDGPYRVGLKTDNGWIYAEGLTHWEEEDADRLILEGHDSQGKLVVALMLGSEPF
ncbi:YojF family protein [Paenibacillus thermotolerans]|uniref:YojF family protein n=1 Tax=Paenibacillus thermotolerans TaxID=3027807 RepID=UPI002368228D|nr:MULTISPECIES: YojF family protein [unclassified Paenibacillus]